MKVRRLLVVVLLAISVQAAAAVDVSVTGFADARADYTLGDTDAFGFKFHSSRVVFGAKLAPWISAVAQLGTNPQTGVAMQLGTATVTLNTVGEGPKMSFMLGRFPVPMGLASGWYLSPNNAFAFAPLITSGMYGGAYSATSASTAAAASTWSDIGAQGAIRGDKYSLQVYLVQGNMPGIIATSRTNNKGVAGGLRAVITPIDGFNFGLSYCLNGREAPNLASTPVPGMNGENKSIIAGDISFAVGPVTLSYEYYAWMPKFTFDERRDGWFAQAEFDLQKAAGIPITPGVRYDYLGASTMGAVNGGAADAASALTVQAVYKFEKYLRLGLSFRTEKGTKRATGADAQAAQLDDSITLQILGMF